MAHALCKECSGFVVVPGADAKQHHANFKELKACARDTKKICRLCRLLWAAVEDQASDNSRAQRYLVSWPSNHVLALRAHESSKLLLRISELPVRRSANTVGTLEIHMPGRTFQIPASFASSASSSVPVIKAWLEKCNHSHRTCGGGVKQKLPARVIYIGEANKCRLIEPVGAHIDKYVALSYCWREDTSGQGVHRLQLTRHSMQAMMQNIDQARMARTHREAVEVARLLGYQYIWIDALCIIQGDKNEGSKSDWALQAHRVPRIYRDADVTLMAGRSPDSRQGFVNLADWYTPPRPVRMPYRQTSHGSASAIDIGSQKSEQWGPAGTRAWCYQESFLSRRTVIFAQQQLIFRCQTGIHHEDGRSGSYLGLRMGTMKSNITKREIFEIWNDVVKEYSAKEMYDPFDRYAAFSGVAKEFQQALANVRGGIKPRYLAGLWETTNMAYELTWRSSKMDIPSGRMRGLFKRPAASRAPSWSWMAVEGPVVTPREEGHPVSRPCCPGARSNDAWASDDWGIDKITPKEIKESLPFKISVKGLLRHVRLGQVITEGYDYGSLDTSPKDSKGLMRYGTPLLDYGTYSTPLVDYTTAPSPDIVALAIMDFVFDPNKEVYVLPTISRNGKPIEALVLAREKTARGEIVHHRLGTCWIRRPEIFKKSKLQVITIG